ncbi:hypothetical protein A1O1_05851 [Capronia coronata CBS 617.96]|uniref:Arylsulfotransferase n=1 Tax=Capronia coronata CBS 617.96 TaxID=1182541 RepID=W9XY81_9EURO|nr:uncharacterized protein A1O1_05851 [Capronia coronata CBS 617.96]EXJ85487.1 hypothetical protein A1O1_05851 [Capronia coronata CBS 617.96]
MRLSLLLAVLPAPWVTASWFNAYDLGFYGLYPRQRFHSVDLEAPLPKITQWDARCDPGSLLFTPRGPAVKGQARGPVMLDANGQLIWMDNNQFEQSMNFKVQRFKGEEYLTFWTKTEKHKRPKGVPKKSYVLLNSSYEVAYRIFPHGQGLKGDSHEFRLTPQGTALITIYHKHKADCTELGLGKSCWIQDGLFQEIDIETGEMLFEWRASDHIRMSDVFSKPNMKDGHGKSKKDAFDFFHINSVDKIDSGDYIISARYMHAVVCVSGKTGEILWQLGGKNNDFEDLNGATDFAWQHHVTWQGNGTISLFDNHANNVFHSPSSHSKGMLIQLDLKNMTARLLQTYVHPDKILNVSQGSVQVLPETGNVLVGYGNSPTYIEFSRDGQVLCGAHWAPYFAYEILDFGLVKSYRVFKSRWVGRPKTVPDVKVKNGKVYVSWNGATEVTGWRLEMAKSAEAKDDDFVTIQELNRNGFETRFLLGKHHGYARVAALDAAKGVMAYSAVVRAHRSSSVLFWTTLLLMFAFASLGFLFWRFPRLVRIPKFDRFPRLARLPRFARSHRLPRLLNLFDFRARSRSAAVRSIREYDHEEADPLLLDERDP